MTDSSFIQPCRVWGTVLVERGLTQKLGAIWNWGVEESRRASKAGEKSPSHDRLRPAFNAAKANVAPWSTSLGQNAAKHALIDLPLVWDRFWCELEAVGS